MTRIRNFDSDIVEIIHDAAIASGSVGEGRFIILLILDHKDRSDIEDLFKIHSVTEAGNADFEWGKPLFSTGAFYLHISFKSPLEVNFTIRFNIEKHGILIETILSNKAVYLQLGGKTERGESILDAHKILLEIPDTGVRKKWDAIWKKSVVRKFRAEGFDKKTANKMAVEIIKEAKQIKNLKFLK